MNYFELFDLPVSFKVDKSGLSKKYFELQKQYHPDYYSSAGAEEQQRVLEISSEINKAFKTFQSEDDTIRYLLQLKGLLQDEEAYKLPPEFLMEVMELNELKMDGAAPEEISKRAKEIQEEIYISVLPVLSTYKEEKTSDEALAEVKSYYYKSKYIKRLL